MAEKASEPTEGAKSSTAQIAAGAGVNITDAQEAALFFSNKGKLEKALAAQKAANKAVQDLGKVIKSDHGDHGYAAMKMAIRFATDDEAHKSAQDEIDMKVRVMRWMGMPVGAQGSLFDKPDRRPADEIAFDRGKLAGMEGKGMKDVPGYDETNPHWQDFAKGWHEGQGAIFNIKGPEALVKGGKGKGAAGVKSAKEAAKEAAAAGADADPAKTKH